MITVAQARSTAILAIPAGLAASRWTAMSPIPPTVVRGPLSPSGAPRPHDGRDGPVAHAHARPRRRAHRRRDARLAARDAMGGHRRALGAPSPNMPTPDTAGVYPGGCLIEGTNLSEGRGTTRPFEWVGAPYLEARAFARRSAAPPAGRVFRPSRSRRRSTNRRGGRVKGCTPCDGPRRFEPFPPGWRSSRRPAGWHRATSSGGRLPTSSRRRSSPSISSRAATAIRRAIERGVPLARIERSWRPASAG